MLADCGRGRKGRGEATDCLLVALDIAAFRTCVRAGLIPHAKQGGRGVCAFAVWASKLDGTGFEKLHMVQTQVAVFVGAGSTDAGRKGLSPRCTGEAVPFLVGIEPIAGDLVWREARFAGFGIKVTFADDFKNPAWKGV